MTDKFNKVWALQIINDVHKYPPGNKNKEIRGLAWATLKRISERRRGIKPKLYFA